MIYQLAADGYNIDINSAFSTNPDGSCTTKNYPATWDHWYSSTKTSRQQARCQFVCCSGLKLLQCRVGEPVRSFTRLGGMI